MLQKLFRFFSGINYPSYVIFFVTARCNARCKMCFYMQNMDNNLGKDELTVGEYKAISKTMRPVNILGISGGEPFLRDDLSDIVRVLYDNCSPLVLDLPTNGYFTKNITRQVKEIAQHCKHTAVDIQVSIDGPEAVHNEIRGLKDGFAKMRETYNELVSIKKMYRNLRIKACIVYSHYNQDHVEELFDMIDRDFTGFDRVVFSVAHGSVSNDEAMKFDWDKYFRFCEKIRETSRVKSMWDLHSVFTVALRITKNEFLKEVLKKKNMYRHCNAGKSVVAIDERGKVYPCEPKWHSVGDLRKNGYNLEAILKGDAMAEYQRLMIASKCNCHWGLPMSNTILYSPRYYPKILWEMARILCRSK